jgi:hypothetical protein
MIALHYVALSVMTDATPIANVPTQPLQRFRRTRIAVSVFCGVLTAALCVLWVRSFFTRDVVSYLHENSRFAMLGFNRGSAYFAQGSLLGGSPNGWDYLNFPLDGDWDFDVMPRTSVFPIWPIVATAAIGVWAGASRLRFSLRTLLVATTLVAVVLGLICYAVR